MFEIIMLLVGLLVLIFASITDLKVREVPDLLSYGLIFLVLGLRVFYAYNLGNLSILVGGLIGFGIMFILACIMFYSGQWGGGDAKLLMGIGALMGFSLNFEVQPLILFLLNLILFGSLFGIAWTVYLFILHWNKSKLEFVRINETKKAKAMRLILFVLGAVCLVSGLFFLTPLILFFFFIFMYYFWIYTKVVENVAMLKYVTPTKLTEGDWIAEDIFDNGHKICGPKDLGIEKDQILELVDLYHKGKIKKVLVKEGLPFVPSFLIAYILTYVLGNWVIYLI